MAPVGSSPTRSRQSDPASYADLVQSIDDCSDAIRVERHSMQQSVPINLAGKLPNIGDVLPKVLVAHEFASPFKVIQNRCLAQALDHSSHCRARPFFLVLIKVVSASATQLPYPHTRNPSVYPRL